MYVKEIAFSSRVLDTKLYLNRVEVLPEELNSKKQQIRRCKIMRERKVHSEQLNGDTLSDNSETERILE